MCTNSPTYFSRLPQWLQINIDKVNEWYRYHSIPCQGWPLALGSSASPRTVSSWNLCRRYEPGQSQGSSRYSHSSPRCWTASGPETTDIRIYIADALPITHSLRSCNSSKQWSVIMITHSKSQQPCYDHTEQTRWLFMCTGDDFYQLDIRRYSVLYSITLEQGCGLGLDISRRTNISSQSRLEKNCQHLGLGRQTSKSRPFTSRAQDQLRTIITELTWTAMVPVH